MADAFETRTVTAEFEFRTDDDVPTLVGHAATFNEPYEIGYFRETISPGAFDKTLRRDQNGKPTADVRLLVDHQGQPLARTKSGTLELGTDAKGLTVRATLDPSDPDVQRLIPKMRRGDMDQMSFGFRVPTGGDSWDYSRSLPDRTIREAVLHGGDVSVVTYPANEKADAQIRARDDKEAAWTLADAMLKELRAGNELNEHNVALMFDALRDLGVDLRATPEADAPDVPETNSAGIPLELAVRLAEAAAARRSAA